MKRAALLLLLALPMVGCESLKRITDGPASTPGPAPLAADYTITGTTTSNFDLIPVRVLNSKVTVRVNRASAPEQGWHDCDQFEIRTSTIGTGGGGVRLWYLNLSVGGMSFPVAPAGTQYEIRSVLN